MTQTLQVAIAKVLSSEMNGKFTRDVMLDMAARIANSKSFTSTTRQNDPTVLEMVVGTPTKAVIVTPVLVNMVSLCSAVVAGFTAAFGISSPLTMVAAGALLSAIASGASSYVVVLNPQEVAYLYGLSQAQPVWQNAQAIVNAVNVGLPPLLQIQADGFALAQSLALKGAKLDWKSGPPTEVLFKDFFL